MAEKFHLEIIASDHPFYKGDCESFIFPGMDGLHGILANHEEMVTCVKGGELKYQVDGEWYYAVVSDGFVEVTPKYVILLADTIERPEDIDVNRADEAKKRAEEKLRQKLSIKEYYLTQAELNRALNRIKAAQKHM